VDRKLHTLGLDDDNGLDDFFRQGALAQARQGALPAS
jgi:hypothetical protein